MKKTTFIVFVMALLFTCRPLMAQTTFQDLPVEFRKNGYPQLVEECKDVLKAAYMAEQIGNLLRYPQLGRLSCGTVGILHR